ncbi:acyl-CoA dehydrogenase [Catellatospora sp. IY07-71]|uniref:acyl-CoA dehydrogenase family protein n=1 Tax=Catellatospora sp. IY07-71 TaxID=2728827 RepID=UPI001BB7F860|nr:acyl-CoA dehydrogenase family protein [Catellatospora sp. IY07-71]BCJ78066.1 acyl-CoA dehydrogenase [Catellatospora sp. IY07-71]
MTLDLRYTEEQELLRDSVRAMLADHAPWTRVLKVAESPEPDDADLWRLLAVETGLAALAVPEHLGGAGGTFAETAVVLEELGRACAPVPYLGTAVAARALLHLDETDLLRTVAAGEVIALALPFSAGPAPAAPPTAVTHGTQSGDDREFVSKTEVQPHFVTRNGDLAGRSVPLSDDRAGGLSSVWSAVEVTVSTDGEPLLNGSVHSVAEGLRARVLLVPAGGGLYAVDTSAAGVIREQVVSLDETRPLCDVSLWNVPARLLASGERAAAALDAALVTGAALLASEQLGLAQWCLDTTVEHLRTRYQFGRAVGSFQALKHRLADLWVELAQARAVARHAAACVATGDPDARLAASLAQAHCGPVAVRAAEECVQLHGGIGFTWEHPAHLYLKRAKSAAIAYGTAAHHRAALATLTDLPI